MGRPMNAFTPLAPLKQIPAHLETIADYEKQAPSSIFQLWSGTTYRADQWMN